MRLEGRPIVSRLTDDQLNTVLRMYISGKRLTNLITLQNQICTARVSHLQSSQ